MGLLDRILGRSEPQPTTTTAPYPAQLPDRGVVGPLVHSTPDVLAAAAASGADRAQRAIDGMIRQDGWANVLTGTGTDRDAWRAGASWSSEVLWKSPALLEQMYMFNDVTHTVVTLPANEMTREFIDVSNKDGEIAEAVMEKLRELDAQGACFEAEIWSRLFGGAIMVVVTDDEPTLDKPLRVERIKNVQAIRVFDRYEVGTILYGADGRPESYLINTWAASFWVHSSRVQRFDGDPVPHRWRQLNMGWGLSAVQTSLREINDFCQAHDSTNALMKDFAQAVITIKGLAAMLAADKDGLVRKRLENLDMVRSVLRMIPLDEGEKLERVTTPLAGWSDLLEAKALRLSASTRIPKSLLMGQSPAGLNATGDSDIRYWYDSIHAKQEIKHRPVLRRVIELVEQSLKIKPDQRSTFGFRPLYQQTEKERAEVRGLMATADVALVNAQILTPQEVRESRWGGEKYSVDTKVDLTLDSIDLAETDDPNTVVDPLAKVGPTMFQANAGATGDDA